MLNPEVLDALTCRDGLHVPVWVPDAATRRIILVENPARLYDF
jgi:hypothetical protein